MCIYLYNWAANAALQRKESMLKVLKNVGMLLIALTITLSSAGDTTSDRNDTVGECGGGSDYAPPVPNTPPM